jgi:hypothetical protein
VTIDRSSITANTTTGGLALAFGGGNNFVGRVYTKRRNATATLTITNTTIASNTAANSGPGDGFGGGIFSEVDCGFLVSCGGGSSAHLTLRSVTMSGNASGSDSGGGRGAGIWSNNNDPTGSVTFDVRDSLLAANMASGTPGNCRLLNTTVVPAGYNIASDSSCGVSFNVFSDGQINPRLGSPPSPTIRRRNPEAPRSTRPRAASASTRLELPVRKAPPAKSAQSR